MPHHPPQSQQETLFPVVPPISAVFGVDKHGKQIQPHSSWRLGEYAKFGARLKRRAEYAADRFLQFAASPGLNLSDTPQSLQPLKYGRPITIRAGRQYGSTQALKRVPAPRLVGVESNPGPNPPRRKRFNKAIRLMKKRSHVPNRAALVAAVQSITRTKRAGRRLPTRGRAMPLRAQRVPIGLPAPPGQMVVDRTSDAPMRVRHREPVALLTNSSSTGAFRIEWFNINPGDPKTFPWLSGLASNYERYKFNSLKFIIKPLLGYTTASQQIGSVCTVYNNDIADAVFEDYTEMSNFGGFTELGAVSGGEYPCNTKGRSNPSVDGSYYRLNGTAESTDSLVPVGTTIHEYYPGRFMVASYGFSTANTQYARLFVEYDVTLIKPMLPDDSDVLYWSDLWNSAPTTANNFASTLSSNKSLTYVTPGLHAMRWQGDDGSVIPGPMDNPDFTIEIAGTCLFNRPGTYLVLQYATGTNVSFVGFPTVGVALDLVSGLNRGTNSSFTVATSGNTAVMRASIVRAGSLIGVSDAARRFTSNTVITTAGTNVEWHVIRIPSLSPGDYTASIALERQSGRELIAAAAALRLDKESRSSSSKDEALYAEDPPSVGGSGRQRVLEDRKEEPFSPSYEVVDAPKKAPVLKTRF